MREFLLNFLSLSFFLSFFLTLLGELPWAAPSDGRVERQADVEQAAADGNDDDYTTASAEWRQSHPWQAVGNGHS